MFGKRRFKCKARYWPVLDNKICLILLALPLFSSLMQTTYLHLKRHFNVQNAKRFSTWFVLSCEVSAYLCWFATTVKSHDHKLLCIQSMQNVKWRDFFLLFIGVSHKGGQEDVTFVVLLVACKAGVVWSGIHELFSGMTLSRHLGR